MTDRPRKHSHAGEELEEIFPWEELFDRPEAQGRLRVRVPVTGRRQSSAYTRCETPPLPTGCFCAKPPPTLRPRRSSVAEVSVAATEPRRSATY